MTTAVHQKPPAKAAEAPKTPAVLYQGFVPVANIDIVSNVRKKYDPAKMQELTESVRDHGVNTPIELRPGKEKGRYEIVAGHRRFKAAQAVGLTQIPAIVKDTTPEEAAVHQVIENIQREDLTPIEEARGFHLLTQPSKDKPAKYTVEQLAQLVDKSTAYVYRAMALLELPAKTIAEIEDGTLTPAHGHQLLRVPADKREEWTRELLEDGYDGRIDSATELREKVENELGRDLAGGRFPKDKPYAGAVACSSCPNNSGNQGMLFDGAEKGTCLLKSCFETKTDQHKADFLEKTKTAHAGAKFVEWSRGYVSEGIRRTGGWIVRGPLDKTKLPKSYGIMIDGDFKLWVCIEEKSTASRSSSSSGGTDWEKHHFVHNAGTEAVRAAEAVESLKIKYSRKTFEEVALQMAQDNNHLFGYFAKAIGAEGKVKVSELKDDQLAALIVCLTRPFGWHPKKKQIEEEAKKKAAKEYAEKKKSAGKKV
jgi:ParB/RepB/Spo0J family partition protein